MTVPTQVAAGKTVLGGGYGQEFSSIMVQITLPDFLLSIQDWDLGLTAGMKQKMGKRASRPLVGWFGVGLSPIPFLYHPFSSCAILFGKLSWWHDYYYFLFSSGCYTRTIPTVHRISFLAG